MLADPGAQLDLFAFQAEGDDDDPIDEGDTLEIVRRILPARSVPMMPIRGPVSIFDFERMGNLRLRLGQAPEKSRVVQKVDLGSGRTKVVGANYPPRWTEADHERERVRRAKQRPPKPTRKAKTRGRKLLDLIGAPDDCDEP